MAMVEKNYYKPLKFRGNMYVFGLRATYNNGLRLKFVPYKVICGLTALARLGREGNYEHSHKGLKFNHYIEIGNWVLDNKGNLLEVIDVFRDNVLVCNNVNNYVLLISDIKEVFG